MASIWLMSSGTRCCGGTEDATSDTEWNSSSFGFGFGLSFCGFGGLGLWRAGAPGAEGRGAAAAVGDVDVVRGFAQCLAEISITVPFDLPSGAGALWPFFLRWRPCSAWYNWYDVRRGGGAGVGSGDTSTSSLKLTFFGLIEGEVTEGAASGTGSSAPRDRGTSDEDLRMGRTGQGGTQIAKIQETCNG